MSVATAVSCGLGAGLLAAAMTASVHLFEDLFKRLTVHWMWWPALGGLCLAAWVRLANRAAIARNG